MSYRISSSDLVTFSLPNRPGWERACIPETLGEGYVDRLALADGLTIAYSSYTPVRDLIEESRVERDNRALTITIAQQGRSAYRGNDGSTFVFLAGHTTATLFRTMRGERRYLAHESVRQWRLIVDEAALRTYALDTLLEAGHGDTGARQLLFSPSNGAMQHIAGHLDHLSGCSGNLLDLQIAALNLLAEQARQLSPPVATTTLLTNDQKKIAHAHDLMLRHYDRALTVSYLCAAVGTNEFKLKQGFRELFGTSPHQMLIDVRMRKARELLETGEHVSRVAYSVGFRHPSSFSAAFQRYYGRAPKELKPAKAKPGSH